MDETPSSPHVGQQESIREEKIRVLELIAEHGQAGYAIYDQARENLQQVEADTGAKISRHAPVSLLKSLAGRHNEHLNATMQAIQQLRAAEGARNQSLSSATGTYMEAAAVDRSGAGQFAADLERFESQTREAEFNTRPYDMRARASSGGGGGGGGGGYSPFAGNTNTTLPLGLLNEYTPMNAGGSYTPTGNQLGHEPLRKPKLGHERSKPKLGHRAIGSGQRPTPERAYRKR
ncbi:MAG: hypothetical protein GY930_11445 [bacterium]|nr:hypothetical protein [bacterium]